MAVSAGRYCIWALAEIDLRIVNHPEEISSEEYTEIQAGLDRINEQLKGRLQRENRSKIQIVRDILDASKGT